MKSHTGARETPCIGGPIKSLTRWTGFDGYPETTCTREAGETVWHHYVLVVDNDPVVYQYEGPCMKVHPEDDPSVDRWKCDPSSPQ